MTAVMPSRAKAAKRVNSPKTSRTGVVISMANARLAANSGGSRGTLYSSSNRDSAAFQSASLVIAEFQNTVATASRKGIASTAKGTRSSCWYAHSIASAVVRMAGNWSMALRISVLRCRYGAHLGGCDSDETSGRDVRGKPGWCFVTVGAFERIGQQPAGEQRVGKSPAPFVEPGDLDGPAVRSTKSQTLPEFRSIAASAASS